MNPYPSATIHRRSERGLIHIQPEKSVCTGGAQYVRGETISDTEPWQQQNAVADKD